MVGCILFLNEFNVSKAVVSDLYRERGDTNFILGSVTSVSRRNLCDVRQID